MGRRVSNKLDPHQAPRCNKTPATAAAEEPGATEGDTDTKNAQAVEAEEPGAPEGDTKTAQAIEAGAREGAPGTEDVHRR